MPCIVDTYDVNVDEGGLKLTEHAGTRRNRHRVNFVSLFCENWRQMRRVLADESYTAADAFSLGLSVLNTPGQHGELLECVDRAHTDVCLCKALAKWLEHQVTAHPVELVSAPSGSIRQDTAVEGNHRQ